MSFICFTLLTFGALFVTTNSTDLTNVQGYILYSEMAYAFKLFTAPLGDKESLNNAYTF